MTGRPRCSPSGCTGAGGPGDLAVAVGDARRVLLDSEDPVVRADWHLARLWLGPAGGGPLVAGTRKRSLVPATHGTKTFLDRKQQVPVAAAEMFVGRRPELQQALRALRSGERAGVLLHGQGRLGKSSLAARIADRCPDHAVAVVFGDYGALAILDAVADAVRANPAARELIESTAAGGAAAAGGDRGGADRPAGRAVRPGREDGQRPLLLVIDDLEQILVADPAGPHRVAPEHAPVLAAVLRAFDPAETDSRLLVTSRFTFTLGGLEARLEAVQLRPLSAVAQRKLQRRQQALTPAERLAERAGLAARAVAVSRGNPGLQDLIGLRLVYGEQVGAGPGRGGGGGHGGLPAPGRPARRRRGAGVPGEPGPGRPAGRGRAGERALLRAVTLFDLPVPEPVIEVLAGQVGGSAARLRGLGLLDPYPDLLRPGPAGPGRQPAGRRADRPAQPRRAGRAGRGQRRAAVRGLGRAAPQPGRDLALDLQLARLALLADDPAITAACAAGAVGRSARGPAAEAFRLGQDAIELLDRHGQPVPLDLLRRTAMPPSPAATARRARPCWTGPRSRPKPETSREPTRWTRPGSSPSEPAT